MFNVLQVVFGGVGASSCIGSFHFFFLRRFASARCTSSALSLRRPKRRRDCALSMYFVCLPSFPTTNSKSCFYWKQCSQLLNTHSQSLTFSRHCLRVPQHLATVEDLLKFSIRILYPQYPRCRSNSISTSNERTTCFRCSKFVLVVSSFQLRSMTWISIVHRPVGKRVVDLV